MFAMSSTRPSSYVDSQPLKVREQLTNLYLREPVVYVTICKMYESTAWIASVLFTWQHATFVNNPRTWVQPNHDPTLPPSPAHPPPIYPVISTLSLSPSGYGQTRHCHLTLLFDWKPGLLTSCRWRTRWLWPLITATRDMEDTNRNILNQLLINCRPRVVAQFTRVSCLRCVSRQRLGSSACLAIVVCCADLYETIAGHGNQTGECQQSRVVQMKPTYPSTKFIMTGRRSGSTGNQTNKVFEGIEDNEQDKKLVP